MTTALEWLPFGELTGMERRMRRFFEDVGVAPVLAPAADVYEADGEYIIELDVPGYDEKELSVSVSEHALTIEGERKEETEEKEKTRYLHERLERHFERRFVLPATTDTEHLKAEYAKGVLTLHVPKIAETAPHKIKIAAAT